MSKSFLLGLFILLSLLTSAQNKDEIAIRQLLANQVTAWNKGNIDGFMKGYWESDSLVFIGKKGITNNYALILENYHNSYPTPEIMGELKSTILTLKKLSTEYYFITGKWEIERTDAEGSSGYYTLLIQKKKGKWVIVYDHSS